MLLDCSRQPKTIVIDGHSVAICLPGRIGRFLALLVPCTAAGAQAQDGSHLFKGSI